MNKLLGIKLNSNQHPNSKSPDLGILNPHNKNPNLTLWNQQSVYKIKGDREPRDLP